MSRNDAIPGQPDVPVIQRERSEDLFMETRDHPNFNIIVLSNRLPFSVKMDSSGNKTLQSSAGGLVTALSPTLRKGNGSWIGWPGVGIETVPEKEMEQLCDSFNDGYDIIPVHMSDELSADFYAGLPNSTLWPLFHCFPDRTTFLHEHWEVYCKANRLFAEAAIRSLESSNRGNSVVWVHDYHLMLTAREIREKIPNQTIVFFLHIPFPPYDVFRLLPWDKEILRALLHFDIIGFHTPNYAENFCAACENLLGALIDRTQPNSMVVVYGDIATEVKVFRLGIDFNEFERNALKYGAEDASDLLPGGDDSGKLILGVDRLDYTKGLPERLRAFRMFLERFPEQHERVVLLQIVVPSRLSVQEYADLKKEIDQLVGEINGRFSTSRWSPIRYIYRSLTREQLTSLYRRADVALVTPLRDGLNLVAKEYTACQVRESGVLILSRFAGTAETMHEALLVNPYNAYDLSDTVHKALTMDDAERRSRMVSLRFRERRYNLDFWVSSWMHAIENSRTREILNSGVSPTILDKWLGNFLFNCRLALFLDYDGTLAPIANRPEDAVISPEMRSALEACNARDDTMIHVISGRDLDNVMGMLREESFTYAGNHGLKICYAKGRVEESARNWCHEDVDHYTTRATELAGVIENAIAGIAGAWVERKGPTVTCHYRETAPAERVVVASAAQQAIEEAGFQPRRAHMAVEARPPIGWDKGRAVLQILRTLYGPSWSESMRVVYVGDDDTDEDAFRMLVGLGVTFRVGTLVRSTAATRRLRDPESVRRLLEYIAAQPNRFNPRQSPETTGLARPPSIAGQLKTFHLR